MKSDKELEVAIKRIKRQTKEKDYIKKHVLKGQQKLKLEVKR